MSAPARRTRLPRQERIERILEVAVRQIGARGFFGLSLQAVADEVGMTLPGMLHYVGTKEGLLHLLVEQRYDHRFDPDDFVASGAPGSQEPSFPAYLRYLVEQNANEPELIRLFSVLSAESSAPSHPAHEYFADRPQAVWELYGRTSWRLPPQIGGWPAMRDLVELAIATMDGLQLRSFRRPPIDLVDEWRKAERVLFPSPVWDGYR